MFPLATIAQFIPLEHLDVLHLYVLYKSIILNYTQSEQDTNEIFRVKSFVFLFIRNAPNGKYIL